MPSLSVPTGRSDWRRITWATRRVLGRPAWVLVGLVAAIASLTMFVAFDNTVYFRSVVLGGSLSPLGRLRALVSLYPDFDSVMGAARGLLLALTAGAVGTNVALLGFHLRHNRATLRSGSGSVVGVALGVLGAGCASCGLAVVASVLSLTGVAAGLTALPLEGMEFLLVALVVTVLSIHWVAAGIESGAVDGCPVDL